MTDHSIEGSADLREVLDLEPIQKRQQARRKIEHLHGSLCLSALEGQQASNDCEELLAEVSRLRAALRSQNGSSDVE